MTFNFEDPAGVDNQIEFLRTNIEDIKMDFDKYTERAQYVGRGGREELAERYQKLADNAKFLLDAMEVQLEKLMGQEESGNKEAA